MLRVLPTLSIFLNVKASVEEKSRKMTPQTARNDQNNMTDDSFDTLFDLSLNCLLSNFIAEQMATAVMYVYEHVSC